MKESQETDAFQKQAPQADMVAPSDAVVSIQKDDSEEHKQPSARPEEDLPEENLEEEVAAQNK